MERHKGQDDLVKISSGTGKRLNTTTHLQVTSFSEAIVIVEIKNYVHKNDDCVINVYVTIDFYKRKIFTLETFYYLFDLIYLGKILWGVEMF